MQASSDDFFFSPIQENLSSAPYTDELTSGRRWYVMTRVIRTTALFLGFSAIGYLLLSGIFKLVCFVGGHSSTEMVWGFWTTAILALALGCESILWGRSKDHREMRPELELLQLSQEKRRSHHHDKQQRKQKRDAHEPQGINPFDRGDDR